LGVTNECIRLSVYQPLLAPRYVKSLTYNLTSLVIPLFTVAKWHSYSLWAKNSNKLGFRVRDRVSQSVKSVTICNISDTTVFKCF